MLAELPPVLLPRAEEERQAVVHAGNDDRDAPGDQPGGAAAAEAVGEGDGVVALPGGPVDGSLQPTAQLIGDLVEAGVERLKVHFVRREREKRFKLGLKDAAAEQLDPHFTGLFLRRSIGASC